MITLSSKRMLVLVVLKEENGETFKTVTVETEGKGDARPQHCAEVCLASFLSGGVNVIISHSSKSIGVIKLSFCQNDPPMENTFWKKDSFITLILFELWLIMIFSPPERKLAKRTSVNRREINQN